MTYERKEGFTRQELIELGINYDNMSRDYGEANIIVQWFGRPKVGENAPFGPENDEENRYAYPDIYHPRKNRIWSVNDDEIDLSDDEQRADFIAHLKDSAERLKVMSLLLSRQAKELEETGYTSTVCYYPEERDRYDYLKNKNTNE